MKAIQTVCAILLSLYLGIATADPININTADASTIASAMKGVGIKRAQAVIEYRDEHGSFKSVDGLTKVKGIGQKTVDKNRENLMIQDPTESTTPAS